MLIALGRGDKYRLTHIRESLETGKELFISDKEFLQDLVKTYLKDRIYQAKIVSTSDEPNMFCESCGSAISADEKFCISCGTAKPEPTPEPETKLRKHGYQENAGFAFADSGDTFEIPITKSLEGFTFTDVGDIGETSTRKHAQKKPQPKKKSRQQELKEYEKKYLIESETNVTWEAYDGKAKKKVKIQNPKVVMMKNGKWAIRGTSPITGVKVFRFVGNKKPTISSEETAESPKVESTAPAKKTAESPKKPTAPAKKTAESPKKPTALAKKTAESPKAEKEVVSRYYKSHEQDSPKVEKPKSDKCSKCGSKISADEIFCTGCGTKR
jgi:predicted nucleic acid-binding Zn ribbon protein